MATCQHQRRRRRFAWQYLPMMAVAIASTWAVEGATLALISAGVGLAVGLVALVWAERRGIDRIRVRARYSVAGTLLAIILGTAVLELLK